MSGPRTVSGSRSIQTPCVARRDSSESVLLDEYPQGHREIGRDDAVAFSWRHGFVQHSPDQFAVEAFAIQLQQVIGREQFLGGGGHWSAKPSVTSYRLG